MIEKFFAVVIAIPILDRWFEANSRLYYNWKLRKNEIELLEALDKAEKEMNTKDLQKEIGEKL